MDIIVHGFCDEKFSKVKEAFINNFKNYGEVGASFAATINGKFVVDIWGGYADSAKTRPWEKDTIVNVYSTTKVMTALCIHILIDRGKLDVEEPVAKYWPEFGQAGKKDLPVKYLLSHSSGLCGWEEPITIEDVYDWDKTTSLLAAQKPWWTPGERSGYHAVTFGHLLGELVRRITGKSIGTFFREEIAEPLGADFFIGLPEQHDSRVGELIPPKIPSLENMGDIEMSQILIKTFNNPEIDVDLTKDRTWRAAEIPGANGHGNARSVTKIASILANGGSLDGIRFLSEKTIDKAIQEQISNRDLVLGYKIRFGLGFGLTSRTLKFSPDPKKYPRTFYWGGYGGSQCVMEPDLKLCFSYAMNKMIYSLTGKTRAAALQKAFYECL